MQEPVMTTQRRPGAEPRERPQPRNRLQTVWLSDVQKRPIEWLWRPFLQCRAINLLTGDPNAGKSTIVCEIAAALSTGRPLPGDPVSLKRPPMNTWIMNGEDAADDTIAWRLDNQGADPKRVLITDQQATIDVSLAREIDRTVREAQIRLLVIDPLQAWMGSDVDMNRANETREWAGILRKVALDTGCAVVFVRHRRKGQPGDNKLYSGLGSIDISGFARCESSAIVGKDGRRYLARTKGNVGPDGDGISYNIESVQEPGNDHGVLRWTGKYVEKVPTTISRTPKALQNAIEWLGGFLKDGPKLAIEVLSESNRLGISERTLRRAKDGLAESRQLENGDWVWQLGPHHG